MNLTERKKSIIEETVKSQDYQNGFQQLVAENQDPIQAAIQKQQEAYHNLLKENNLDSIKKENSEKNNQIDQLSKNNSLNLDTNNNQSLLNQEKIELTNINTQTINQNGLSHNSNGTTLHNFNNTKSSLVKSTSEKQKNSNSSIQLNKQKSFTGGSLNNTPGNAFKFRKQSINTGGLERTLLNSYSNANKIASNDTILKRTSSQTSINNGSAQKSGNKESLTSKLMNFRNQNQNFNNNNSNGNSNNTNINNNIQGYNDLNSPINKVNKKITILKLPEQKKEEEIINNKDINNLLNETNQNQPINNIFNPTIDIFKNTNINNISISPQNFQNPKFEEELNNFDQSHINYNQDQMNQVYLFYQMMQCQLLGTQQQQQQQQSQQYDQSNKIKDQDQLQIFKDFNKNSNLNSQNNISAFNNEDNISELSEENLQKEDIPNRRWTQEEHNKYLEFYQLQPELMSNTNMKKSKKAYKLMSKYIKTRNPTQCRTHDQKFSSYSKSNNSIKNGNLHLKQQVKSHNLQNSHQDNRSPMYEIHQNQIMSQQVNIIDQVNTVNNNNTIFSQQQMYSLLDNMLNNILEQSQSLQCRIQNLHELADLI